MPNTIRIKRRAAGGASGSPSSLAAAELAYNEQDDVLYYGKGDSGGEATSIPAIGGPGAYVSLAGTQTISGAKTFSGASDLGALTIATTQAGSDNSTRVATTAFVKGQGYLTANQAISLSGDVTGSGTTAITATLANAGTAGTYTKVTTDAKGRVTSGTTLGAGDIPTLTAAKISDFDTQVRTSRLDQMTAPTGSLSLNSQKITNLATPTLDTDATTKAYVDALAQGLSWKASVRAATTANITLSGTQTIDGVEVTAGDRVLVKDQSTATANGIYVVAAGAWARATDADVSAEVPTGLAVFVSEGTASGDKAWVLTTNAPITLGTTGLAFAQMTGSASGETNTASNVGAAGTGVYDGKSGVDLQFRKINAASSKISVTLNGQQLDLDVVPGNITALGTLVTGTWQATAIGLAYGGTGANLSGAADGAIFKKSGTGLIAATVGSDYLSNASAIDGGTF